MSVTVAWPSLIGLVRPEHRLDPDPARPGHAHHRGPSAADQAGGHAPDTAARAQAPGGWARPPTLTIDWPPQALEAPEHAALFGGRRIRGGGLRPARCPARGRRRRGRSCGDAVDAALEVDVHDLHGDGGVLVEERTRVDQDGLALARACVRTRCRSRAGPTGREPDWATKRSRYMPASAASMTRKPGQSSRTCSPACRWPARAHARARRLRRRLDGDHDQLARRIPGESHPPGAVGHAEHERHARTGAAWPRRGCS